MKGSLSVRGTWAALREALGQRVDASSLGLFRVAFGLLIAFEFVVKLINGSVRELTEPSFHFTYWPWRIDIVPSEEVVFALHYTAIGLALFVAAGFLYRAACGALALIYWWYLFSDATLYINHTYLYCLLLVWMTFIPADQAFSLHSASNHCPSRRRVVPVWCLYLLRGQMAGVYFFGGVAKLNADWLRGAPLSLWLPRQAEISPLGDLLTWAPLPTLLAYGGLAFDLTIVPLLLWRRTRGFGFCWAFAFHVSNAAIFGIASFPWMSLALTSLFASPDWPRRLARGLHQRFPSLSLLSGLDAFLWRGVPAAKGRPIAHGFLVLILGYALLQIALPLRRFVYPGCTDWTEQGHRFAWRMMLRTKTGRATLQLRDPESGRTWKAKPKRDLTRRQIAKMSTHPDLLHEYAIFLAEREEAKGGQRPQVFVESRVQLNDHAPRPLVDPDVDLASMPRSLAPATWIIPFDAGTCSSRTR